MYAGTAIRWATLGLLIAQHLYWAVTESSADAAKPKLQPATPAKSAQRFIMQLFVLFMALQLLGVINFLTFKQTLAIAVLGFAFAALGFYVCVSARRTLGNNWSHGVESQVKRKQELVTHGIYHYIRHPIYVGLALEIVGVQLVAHCYLAFILAPTLAFAMLLQARREEALLTKHYGQPYRDYMAHTRMFIPLIW